MHNIDIVEDEEKAVDELHYPVQSIKVTAQQAEDMLVSYELPGTMGRAIYRIKRVIPEERCTVLEDTITGEEVAIGKDTLGASYDRLRAPRPGQEYTIEWIEHMNGRGEWVKVTPEIPERSLSDPFSRNGYHGEGDRFYKGHEQTRKVEKTFNYIPPEWREYDVYSERTDELEVYSSSEISSFNVIEGQLAEHPPGRQVVGQVYVNSDFELVWYNLNYNLTNKYSETPFTALGYIG